MRKGGPKALICGISGQDGAYLASYLLSLGYQVCGTSRDAQANDFRRLMRLGIGDRVTLKSMAGNDFRSVFQVLREIQPDEIYNLAGQTSVGLSFEQPVEAMDSISTSTINLLEVLRLVVPDARLYNACSTECFGDTKGKSATETTPFSPCSPYGVAKAAAFWAITNYRQAYDLFACNGILSNHESSLRPSHFVTQKIIFGALEIANGQRDRLALGDLSIARDWGWAPEYVVAMHAMLQQESPDDYLIATGVTCQLQDFVEKTFAQLDLNWRNYVQCQEDLLRPRELISSHCDPQKARETLGWRSQVGIDGVIGYMLKGACGDEEIVPDWSRITSNG